MRPKPEHDIDNWDPHAYWVEYYGGDELPSDERAMFSFFVRTMKKNPGPYERVLDLGSGPTVHRLAPFVTAATEIEVADFDPRNREHVEAWLRGSDSALPWEKFFGLTLELEGGETDSGAIHRRQKLLRERISRTRHCDLRKEEPLGAANRYDLVTSFFCADSITASKERWREFVARVLRLVKPGGRIVMTALAESEGYPIGDLMFPSPTLSEADLEQALLTHSFDPATLEIERIPLPDEERRPYASLGYILAATAVRGDGSTPAAA